MTRLRRILLPVLLVAMTTGSFVTVVAAGPASAGIGHCSGCKP